MTQSLTETKRYTARCLDVTPPSVKKSAGTPMKFFNYAHDSHPTASPLGVRHFSVVWRHFSVVWRRPALVVTSGRNYFKVFARNTLPAAHG